MKSTIGKEGGRRRGDRGHVEVFWSRKTVGRVEGVGGGAARKQCSHFLSFL